MKKKITKKILKVVVVLLISIAMVFSSVAVANTKTIQECNPSIDVEKEVWDEKNNLYNNFRIFFTSFFQ